MRSMLRDTGIGLTLVLITAVATFSAYQGGRQWDLDVGSLYDGPFVQRFHDREANAEFTFRWSRPQSLVVLPALGIAGWHGYIRLAAPPAADRWPVTVNGVTQNIGPGVTLLELSGITPDIWTGTWSVKIETPAFRPAGDPRELGVAVDRMFVSTASPLVWPPLLALIGNSALVLWTYWIARALRWNRPLAAVPALCCTAILSALTAWDRPNLYALWPRLPLLLAVWSAVIFVVRPVCRRFGFRLDETQGRLAASVVALQAVWALAYMLHPQAHIWDATFHVHRLEFVAAGQLTVPVVSQEFGTRPIPYPPLSYLPLVPFYWVGMDTQVLIRLALATVILAATFTVSLLAFKAGLEYGLAALVFATLPINVMVLSWGIYANLVGLLLALLLALNLVGFSRPIKAWILGTASLLSHVSMVVLVPVWLLLTAAWRRFAEGRWVGTEIAVALAAIISSYLLFYFLWTGQMASEFGSIVSRRAGTSEALVLFAGGSVSDPGVGLYRTRVVVGDASKAGQEPGFRTVISNSLGDAMLIVLRGAYMELRAFINEWPALLVPFGLLLTAGTSKRFLAVTLAVITTAALFWIIGVTSGLFVRYLLFIAPFAALLAAACLGAIGRRCQAGLATVVALALYQLTQDVELWTHRLLTVGH